MNNHIPLAFVPSEKGRRKEEQQQVYKEQKKRKGKKKTKIRKGKGKVATAAAPAWPRISHTGTMANAPPGTVISACFCQLICASAKRVPTTGAT